MMVPDPPASGVPPITPAATARNMIWLPPACGSIEPMRNASRQPVNPASTAGQHEIADLEAGDADAGLARAGLVGAGSDRMQPPARVAQHHVQHDHHQQRPQDLAIAPRADHLREAWRCPAASPACRARSSASCRSPGTSVPSVVTKDGTASNSVTTPFTSPTRRRPPAAPTAKPAHGDAGIGGEVHDERRQGEHHAGGEIDLAADHQHDLAAGDDRGRSDELRQILQAGTGQQEVVVGVLEPGDQQQRHDQDAGLLPAHEARPARRERIRSDLDRAGARHDLLLVELPS